MAKSVGPSPSATIEPLDRTQAQAEWIAALLESGKASAALNARAARWTAASVFSAGVSAIFGYL